LLPASVPRSVPPIEFPGRQLTNLGDDVDPPTEKAEVNVVEQEEPAATPVELDDDAFLFPIWSGTFWIMPPGGLTRHLIPQLMPINPEATLASSVIRPQQVPTGP